MTVHRLTPLSRRFWLLAASHKTPLTVLIVSVVAFGGLLLSSRPEVWLDLVGAALVILTAAISVILTRGVVSDDLRTGAMQLWLQKPVHPGHFYLARFAESVGTGCIIIALVVLATRLMTAGLGWTAADDLILVLPRLLLTVLLVSSIAFGLSAWVPQAEGIGTLVLFFAGMLLERDMAVRPDMFGVALTPVIRAFLFPESALTQIHDFVSGRGDRVLLPLARVLAFGTVWVVIGFLGVRRATRHGGLARSQEG